MNDWYTAADEPELVEHGPVRGLSVSGVGAPGGPEHVTATQAIYQVAPRLLGEELPPLEGRWWVEDDRPPLTVPRERWRWHLFLRLPEPVEAARVDEAREAAGTKIASRIQLAEFAEGSCVQVMHHGAFADEPRTLGRMAEFITAHGLEPNGLHHELYLTGLAENGGTGQRTILRQPVRPSSLVRTQ
jgi:hypothetical protein